MAYYFWRELVLTLTKQTKSYEASKDVTFDAGDNTSRFVAASSDCRTS